MRRVATFLEAVGALLRCVEGLLEAVRALLRRVEALLEAVEALLRRVEALLEDVGALLWLFPRGPRVPRVTGVYRLELRQRRRAELPPRRARIEALDRCC